MSEGVLQNVGSGLRQGRCTLQAGVMTFGARFLLESVGFSRDLGQRSWGAHDLSLELGGRGYRLMGLSEVQAGLLRARFDRFCLDVTPETSVPVHTFVAETGWFRPPPPAPWVYALDLEHAATSIQWVGFREAGTLVLGPAMNACMWTVASEGDMFARAVENVLRLVVAYALLEDGGALFHGACVLDGGSAVLFPGVSGAGKTTTSRLSAAEGRTVLSDDIVGVLPGPGGYDVVALPFGSEFRLAGPREARFPLRAMCRLEKGEVTDVTSLKPAAALGLALACTPFVNQDPLRVDRLFGTLGRLTGTIPLRTLRFPKDGPIWSALPQGAL